MGGYCMFSNNFGGINDDNWTLQYYPEGMGKNDGGRGSIFLRILRKPDKIKKVKIKYEIAMDTGVVVKDTHVFSDINHSNGHWMKKQLMRPDRICQNNKRFSSLR